MLFIYLSIWVYTYIIAWSYTFPTSMDVSVQLIFVTISVVGMDINFLPWLLECRDNCTLWPSCLHGSSGREKLGLASLRLCTIPESAQKTLHHFTQAFQFIVTPPKRRGSGDIWPIPQGSLLSREIFFLNQSHCRKHNLQCNTRNP